jgi:hypothetical protein
VYSEPPPAKPYSHGLGSSTPTIGERSLFAALPEIAHPSPHLTAQIPSQRFNHETDTFFPEKHDGSTGLDESEDALPRSSSQIMIQDSPSDADRNHSGVQQGGQPSGHVSRGPSRRSTGGSEPYSLMPIDPEPFDYLAPYGKSNTPFQRNSSG